MTKRFASGKRRSVSFTPEMHGLSASTLENRLLTVPFITLTSGTPALSTYAEAATNTYDQYSTPNGLDDDVQYTETSGGDTQKADSENQSPEGDIYKESALATQTLSGPVSTPGSQSTNLTVSSKLQTSDYAYGVAEGDDFESHQFARARVSSGGFDDSNPTVLSYSFGDTAPTTPPPLVTVELTFSANWTRSTDSASILYFRFNTPWFNASDDGYGNGLAFNTNSSSAFVSVYNSFPDHSIVYHDTVTVPETAVANISYVADLQTYIRIPGVGVADNPVEQSGNTGFSFDFGLTIENG